MNYKKLRAFIFGLIPMTLMQYYYWNWMIKSWTNEIDGLSEAVGYFYIPVILTLAYYLYEKYMVFSIFI